MDGKLPRSVLVVEVQTVYFQCSRALLRAPVGRVHPGAAQRPAQRRPHPVRPDGRHLRRRRLRPRFSGARGQDAVLKPGAARRPQPGAMHGPQRKSRRASTAWPPSSRSRRRCRPAAPGRRPGRHFLRLRPRQVEAARLRRRPWRADLLPPRRRHRPEGKLLCDLAHGIARHAARDAAAGLWRHRPVRKQRCVYMAGRTRIHLDRVEGLGNSWNWKWCCGKMKAWRPAWPRRTACWPAWA